MKRTKLADSVPPGRVFAYVRASTSKQIASPENQKAAIAEYAARHGLNVDGYFVDPATSSKLDLFDRPAGKKLLVELRPGDVLIVAKLDRLSRSYIEFATTLGMLEKRKIVLHVCDMPAGVFDPTNPISMLLIQILVSFANFERTMIRTRTKEALHAIKARGERYCRHAAWGMKWEKRWDSRQRKHIEIQVPCEEERKVTMKCVELKAAGYSLDQIRQYLTYKWKVAPRPLDGKTTKEWHNRGVQRLIQIGLEWLAEPDNLTKQEREDMEAQPDD